MLPPVGAFIVDGERSQIFWIEPGVAGIRIKTPCVFNTADAEQVLSALERLGVHEPRPVLVDIRVLRGVTLGVRQMMSSPRAGRCFERVALIADSPLTRTIGNFFVRLNRPPFPLRIVAGEQAGLDWLKSAEAE